MAPPWGAASWQCIATWCAALCGAPLSLKGGALEWQCIATWGGALGAGRAGSDLRGVGKPTFSQPRAAPWGLTWQRIASQGRRTKSRPGNALPLGAAHQVQAWQCIATSCAAPCRLVGRAASRMHQVQKAPFSSPWPRPGGPPRGNALPLKGAAPKAAWQCIATWCAAPSELAPQTPNATDSWPPFSQWCGDALPG